MGAALQGNIKNNSSSNIYYYDNTEIAKFYCDQSIHHQLKPYYNQSGLLFHPHPLLHPAHHKPPK